MAEAPAEVVETLIAHELAHVYHQARGVEASKVRTEERAIQRRLEKWGHEDNQIEVWSSAQKVAPGHPHETFDAFRFIYFRRPPPPTANLAKIAEILEERGHTDLAAKVREVPSGHVTPASPSAEESTPAGRSPGSRPGGLPP
jgi:hypothetical protein